ncbi:MAG: aconitase X [Cohaesibacter sp.]|jgi:predicted aconitase/predicted aconitase with swiveling domain|nr:aconitase X [Cohaesibacter sp.]
MSNLSDIFNFSGSTFVSGSAQGPLLCSDLELSFWGGVNPAKGEVIDRHHPLCGQELEDKILVLPGGRGSCSGSSVILEMLLNGKGPKALVVSRPDDIITLGVVVAREIFNRSIPVVMLEADDFKKLFSYSYARIDGERIICGNDLALCDGSYDQPAVASFEEEALELSERDRQILDGAEGQAAQTAMRVIVQMAVLAGAERLIDVAQVHIDACVYVGQASLAFAQELCRMGGKVAVPTSLNSLSVDYNCWRAQGIDPQLGEPATALAKAYTDMGARSTFTCAPYLLETAPLKGEQIAWAESNAVVFANSVLGARTMKYPDFLDVCIALTGRAPCAGPHLDQYRQATLCVRVGNIQKVDDAFYPLLGYQVGMLAANRIAVVDGTAHLSPSVDDLKAFGAAFATVSSALMFHIAGVTPEAMTVAEATGHDSLVEVVSLEPADLASSWEALNKADAGPVDLVSLGNPHFSLGEFRALAALCEGKVKSPSCEMVITAGREIIAQAQEAGYLAVIERFGARIVSDTCWCMIEEPVIPKTAQVILTNSAKYAHYGPGITGRAFRLGSLSGCVTAAISGAVDDNRPDWMSGPLL